MRFIGFERSLSQNVCEMEMSNPSESDGVCVPCSRRCYHSQLPGGGHSRAGDPLVQGCQSCGAFGYYWHLQWWHRVADQQHPPRRHRGLYVHRSQRWGASFPHCKGDYSGRRRHHGKSSSRQTNSALRSSYSCPTPTLPTNQPTLPLQWSNKLQEDFRQQIKKILYLTFKYIFDFLGWVWHEMVKTLLNSLFVQNYNFT